MKCSFKEKIGMIKLFLIAIFLRTLAIIVSNKSILLTVMLIALAFITRKLIIIVLIYYIVSIYIFNKVIYRELNDYLIINRYSGTIHMNMKLDKKYFETNNDLLVLRNLCRGFEAGLLLIPDKIRNNIFLKRKKVFKLNTHEAIFRVIDEKYNLDKNSYKIIKKGIVCEKLLLCNLRDIFVRDKYKKLIDKSNKYKIIINIKDIREILSYSN